MGGVLLLVLVAVGCLVLAGLVLFVVRLRGSQKSEQDVTILRITEVGAVVYGALVAIGTLWSAIATIAAPQIAVSLPVRTFWPEPNPGVYDISGPTAEVVGGGFAVAQVEVTGLDLPARLFLAGGTLVHGAVFVLLAVVVAMLCHQLRREAPFASTVTAALTGAGIALGIGGVVWQALYAIGSALAAEQALRIEGWASDAAVTPDGSTEHGLPEPALMATIEFWPIFIALALLAVAAAFRIGERMQRETAGLV